LNEVKPNANVGLILVFVPQPNLHFTDCKNVVLTKGSGGNAQIKFIMTVRSSCDLNAIKEVIMSKQSLPDIAPSAPNPEAHLSEPIADILREIQQTPREHWPKLVQMLRLFREAVTVEPRVSEEFDKIDITKLSQEERIKRNQAAIELLRSWREDDDDEEQKETAEYLEKVLDEDRLSNRPLFP